MIIAVWKHSCAVSNSAEGGDVKTKSCSLSIINDQIFLMFKIRFLAIFVLYKAKDVVYLAICRVFKFFRLFKIGVVYLAIFVVPLAKPLILISNKEILSFSV